MDLGKLINIAKNAIRKENKMDFKKFVDKTTPLTPPLIVDVIDERGRTIYSYEAPSGFQLDKYVHSLFPQATLMVADNYTDLTVSVIIPGTKDIYQIHRAMYKPQNR